MPWPATSRLCSTGLVNAVYIQLLKMTWTRLLVIMTSFISVLYCRKSIPDLLHTLGLSSNLATQSATLVKGSYN